MTVELTPVLQRILEDRRPWGPDEVRTAIDTAVDAAGPSLQEDWDEQDGEEWARILVGHDVMALISAVIPLAFVAADQQTTRRWQAQQLEIVPVDSMDSPSLRADVEILKQAFPELSELLIKNQTQFSAQAFSAHELWYLTV